MEHKTKIVAKKKLADGQLAVLLRCCDDQTTDSWHTLHFNKNTKPADVDAWLADRHQHVQDGHEAARLLDEHIASLMID